MGKSVVQNEQRYDLVGEKGSDYLRGQPRGEWLLSEPLNKVTGKKKQQLIRDQQDGERYRQHAHAQPLARGDLCGQSPLECRVDRRNLHRLWLIAPDVDLRTVEDGIRRILEL